MPPGFQTNFSTLAVRDAGLRPCCSIFMVAIRQINQGEAGREPGWFVAPDPSNFLQEDFSGPCWTERISHQESSNAINHKTSDKGGAHSGADGAATTFAAPSLLSGTGPPIPRTSYLLVAGADASTGDLPNASSSDSSIF
jgi:hypothetical protein